MLAVAVALVALRTDFVLDGWRRAIEAGASVATGEDVRIGRLSVTYLPLVARVEGLVVSHPETRQVIVATPAIAATVGLDGWVPGLLLLEIDRPRVALHVDEDGLREFRRLQGGRGELPSRFPWRDLRITDGSFVLDTPGAHVEVDGIEWDPRDDGAARLGIATLLVQADGVERRARAIAMPGVHATPRGVEIPSVRVDFGDLVIDGSLAAAETRLAGELSVHVDPKGWTFDPAEPRFFLDGAVDADVSLSGTPAAPVADVELATRALVLHDFDDEGTTVERIFGDARGHVHVEGDTVRVDPLAVDWGEGAISVQAEIALSTLAAKADVLAEDVSLAAFLRDCGASPAPWIDFRGDVETHVTGTLDPFRFQGPAKVTLGDLVVRAGPHDGNDELMLEVSRGIVHADLDLDLEHIVIDGHDVRFGSATRGRARASIGFGSNGPLSVDVDMDRVDLEQVQPLSGAGLGGVASVRGWLGGGFDSLSAEATVAGQDLVVLQYAIADRFTTKLKSPDLGSLRFSEIAASLGQSDWRGQVELIFDPAGMRLDTQVFVPAARVVDFTSIFVDLPWIDGAVDGTVSVAGPLDALDGHAQLRLADVALAGEQFPEGRAVAWMDGGRFTLEELSLRRGGASVLARGSIADAWAMDIEVLADGLRIEELDALRGSDLGLSGDLSADVLVGGTLFDWRPRGRVVARDARLGDFRLADSRATFDTDADGWLRFRSALLGDAAGVEGRVLLARPGPYDLHATLRDFPLHAAWPVAADGQPLLAVVGGTVDVAGELGGSAGGLDLDARLDDVRIAWDRHELRGAAPWSIALHQGAVQVAAARLSGGDTALDIEASTGGDGRVLVRAEGKVDLDLARAVAPGVLSAGGTGRVGVDIERPPGGPARAHVAATVRGASLRTEYFPASFTELRADIDATSDAYVLRDVSAVVGGGRFRGEGSIAAVRWRPQRYDLRGKLTDGRVQYLADLPPMSGNADLRFDGPVGSLLLAGTVQVSDMVFRDRVDWEANVLSLRQRHLTDSASKARGNYFNFDLRVVADGTMHLRNNLADADGGADLRIVGDTARPGMTGTVALAPGGHAYLQDRDFDVTRAELRFIDPYTFDPDLDILLETDVRGHDQDVHVLYAVTGPFSNWRTETSSVPSMAQADINALLLFGMTREEFERYGGVGAALGASAADLLGAQLVGDEGRLLDRWTLVSGVNERGSTTSSTDLRLVVEKEWADFRFTGETNFAADHYVAVERQLTTGLFAGTYFATQQEGRALDAVGAIGAELKYRWEWD
jgi:hypothetical protein